MNEIQKESRKHNIYQYFTDLEVALENCVWSINNIQKSLVYAIQNRELRLYVELNWEIANYFKNLYNSSMYTNYCKFMYTYYFTSKKITNWLSTEQEDDPSISEDLRQLLEQPLDQDEVTNHTETHDATDHYAITHHEEETKIANLEVLLENTQKDLDYKTKELEEKTNELSLLQTRYEQEHSSIKSDNGSSNGEIRESIEENISASKYYKDKLKEKENLVTTLIDGNETKNKTIVAQEKVISLLESKLKEKKKEVKRLNAIISQKESSYKMSESKIERRTTKYNLFDQSIEECKSENFDGIDETNSLMVCNPDQLIKMVTSENVDFEKEYNLEFNMDEEWDRLALREYSFDIGLTLSTIRINNSEEDDADVKLFLERNLPKVSSLIFNKAKKQRLTLSVYTKSIVEALPSINNELNILRCKVSSSDLNALFPAAKHLETLCIQKCTITIDDPLDFGAEIDYKIKYIYFRHSGASKYSDWKEYKMEFVSIVTAMARTKLKQSLQTLCMKNCGFELATIERIVKDTGFNNLEIQV